MNELLSCPFCGGEATLELAGIWYVRHKCDFVTTWGFATEAEAIAAWNSRAERTCHIEGRYGNQYCTYCGEMVGTWDSTSELCISSNAIELWNYCPNCGCKVVK